LTVAAPGGQKRGVILARRPVIDTRHPPDRARLLLFIALVALATVYAHHPRRCIDFGVFRTAGERFLAGTPLYRAEDGVLPFKYAPAMAVLFAPLGLVSRPLGALLWNIGSVGMLWLALRRLEAFEPGPRLSDGTWATVLLSTPVATVLFYGQIDLWLLGLLCLAAAAGGAVERGGTALGLATLSKPPAVLAVVFFAVERRWRALGIAAAVVAALWAVYFLRLGFPAGLEQLHSWQALVERSTVEWVTGPNPQGLPTVLLDVAGWLGVQPGPRLLWTAEALAMLGLGATVLARRQDVGTAFRLTCLAVLLASPLAWRANFVLAIPSLRVAVQRARRRDRLAMVAVAVAAVTTVLTAGVLFDRTGTERVLAWRPWTLLGVLLLVLDLRRPPPRMASEGADTVRLDPGQRPPVGLG
jgi:hypothetical protein